MRLYALVTGPAPPRTNIAPHGPLHPPPGIVPLDFPSTYIYGGQQQFNAADTTCATPASCSTPLSCKTRVPRLGKSSLLPPMHSTFLARPWAGMGRREGRASGQGTCRDASPEWEEVNKPVGRLGGLVWAGG